MSTSSKIMQDLIFDIVTDAEGNFFCFGEGIFHRVYLFCLKHREKGDIESYILFKVQRDEYTTLPPQNIYNPYVDQLWNDEYKSLQKLKYVPHIVTAKEILQSEGEGAIHFAPMCYCLEHKLFFHLPCPVCGGVMKNCDMGIFKTIYATSLERYIYCPNPNCRDSVSNKTRIYYNTLGSLYSSSTSFNLPQTNSSSIKELALFSFVSRKSFLELLLTYSKDYKSKSRLAADIPCLQCNKKEIFGGCNLFRIFSFYEFYALPLQISHYPLSSLLEMLSGRKAAEMKKELVEKKWYFALNTHEEFDENTCYSFQFDKNSQDRGLEVLYLKVKLFLDICLSLQKVHNNLGVAQIHFTHDNIMVVQEKISEILKGNFHPGLFMSGLSSIKTGFIPQYNLFMPYAMSPLLREKISRIHDPQYQFWGDIVLENQTFQFKPEKINVAAPHFFVEDYIEWFYQEDKESKVNLGIITKIKEAENTLYGNLLVAQSQNIKNGRVQFRHYPNLGPQEDIYPLGKLFLYILFFNQKNNFSEIEKFAQDMENYLATCPFSISVSELEKKISSFQNPHLEDKNIFYDIQDAMNILSSQGIKNIIPKPIWNSILLLIFRMITTKYIHFSLIHQQNKDFLQEVTQSLEEILKNIKDKLFKRVSFYDISNPENFEKDLMDELKQDMQLLSESQIARTFSSMSQENKFMYAPNVTGVWDLPHSQRYSRFSWWKRWWKK